MAMWISSIYPRRNHHSRSTNKANAPAIDGKNYHIQCTEIRGTGRILTDGSLPRSECSNGIIPLVSFVESPRGEVHIESTGRSEGNKLLAPAVSNWEHTRDPDISLPLRILPIVPIRDFLFQSTGDLLNAHNINREYLRMNPCIERFLSSFDTDI